MSANVTNQVAFLRTTRNFPAEIQQLSVEVNLAYVDTANKVNSRTIGIFTQNVASLNGEEWFVNNKNQKQQGFRKVYPFGAAPTTIAHNLNVPPFQFTALSFVRIFGTFTDGTNWYPLPYVNSTAANNQISLSVTPTNIVITPGGGAPPAITSGYVVLEWISQP
jgi:hypothetical protein